MTRNELITQLAQLYTGLQVPVSVSMPLGVADEAWRSLNTGLNLFGWVTVEDVKDAINKVLDNAA